MTAITHRTLRELAEAHAADQYARAMAQGKILELELVENERPSPDVHMFGARDLGAGALRVGIVFHWPGLHGALYHGADVQRTDAPRWFSERGVPTVRVARPKRL